MIYWFRKYFSEPKAHGAAIYEVAVTALFSLAPFLITYFIESAKRPDGSFIEMGKIVGRGQLYLLVYGVFGAIVWLAFMKGDRPRHDARAFLGLIATILMMPIVGYLGVDPTFSTVLNPNIVNWGYWFYGVFLVLNYLLLFYMNVNPPEPSEVLQREADDMRDRYKELP